MEHIKQAVDRARARNAGQPSPSKVLANSVNNLANESPTTQLSLDPHHLETMRIVSHDVMDWRAKPFDILRTQVLHTMDRQKWHVLGITSPTPECGKTLNAVNLSLSIGRQPEKQVLLIDMDLQRPRVSATLGLKRDKGLLGVLEGRAKLSEAVVDLRVGHSRISVLACETATSYSSDWMASREMENLLQEVRQRFSGYTIILDLPPILSSNDVIAILPKIDCVLMVVAVDHSRPAEIEQSLRYLQSTEVVRVLLNKAPEVSHQHYYY